MAVPIRPEDLPPVPGGTVAVDANLIIDDGDGVWKATPPQVLEGAGGVTSTELAASGASALVGFIQSGTGSLAQTVQGRLRNTMLLTDKGTTADMDTALADVFTDFVAGGRCLIPAGTWTLAATASFPGTRLHLEGAGSQITKVSFEPGSADVALEYSRTVAPASSGVEESSIRRLAFTGGANTQAKTAIRLVNVANCVIEDIGIAGDWLGDSIGIDIAGRQFIHLRDSTLACARPLVYRQNATFTSLTADHSSISGLNFVGTSASRPIIEFADGSTFSNFAVENTALAGGRGGIEWLDTTSVVGSAHVQIENTRGEQGLALTGSVTGVTNANPAVITTGAAHGMIVGDVVSFASVGGTTQLNSNHYVVGTVPTSTSFSLLGIDSTGYGTYTSGGTWTSYGWLIRLETTAQTLRELTIAQTRFAEDRNGLRLRQTINIELVECLFNQPSTMRSIDIAMHNEGRVRFEGCYVAGDFRIANGRPVIWPQGALSKSFTAEFAYEANATFINGVYTPGTTYEAGMRRTMAMMQGVPFSLANDGTAILALNTFCGTVEVINHTDGNSAVFSLNGANETTTKFNESAANLWTNALTTASRANVGYSSGYKLENKLGATKVFSYLLRGGFIS